MKKITILACLLGTCAIFGGANAANFDRTDIYISLKGSYAMPDASGSKSRTSTPDDGTTWAFDYENDLKTDVDSKMGFKPAVGMQFNLPEIYGNIRVEIEYTDLGSMTIGVKSPMDQIDSSNIGTKFPGMSGNLASIINDMGSLRADSYGIYGNVYYALRTGGRLMPYIGAGAGYSSLKTSMRYLNGAYFGQTKKTFSGLGFNFSAGVETYLASSLTLDIGYRFSYLGKLDFDMDIYDYDTTRNGGTTSKLVYRDSNSIDIMAHEITFGLRYKF